MTVKKKNIVPDNYDFPQLPAIGIEQVSIKNYLIQLDLFLKNVVRDYSSALNKFRSLQSQVLVYRSAVQSIPNNTETAVLWDREYFNTDTMHSLTLNTERLIPATAPGKYFIFANMEFDFNATGERLVWIKDNTGLVLGSVRLMTDTITNTHLNVCTITRLIAAQYVQCNVFQSSGAALNIGPNVGITRFGMFFIGE